MIRISVRMLMAPKIVAATLMLTQVAAIEWFQRCSIGRHCMLSTRMAVMVIRTTRAPVSQLAILKPLLVKSRCHRIRMETLTTAIAQT